jgi:hypothetical protein
VRDAFLRQIVRERDLEVRVIKGQERPGDHGKPLGLRTEMGVDQPSKRGRSLFTTGFRHLLEESLEQRREVRNVLIHDPDATADDTDDGSARRGARVTVSDP